MARTLLYVGCDEALRADLPFIPGEVVRARSLTEARAILARATDDTYLLAYSGTIAAAAACTGTQGPLFDYDPQIVLCHDDVPPAAWAGGMALGATRVVVLPADWPWLLHALADTADLT